MPVKKTQFKKSAPPDKLPIIEEKKQSKINIQDKIKKRLLKKIS
jgi:hypothetical protein